MINKFKIKNEKLKIILTFFSLLLLATFLRVYQLDKVPPSPSLDEVSIGWNAYSISQTGMDEYRTRFPILLRAYDDWRPALYVYLVIPFLKIFGLNVLSVRLPSVILSILTILATYFLVKELFPKFSLKYYLLTTFLLTISPWHIYLSRLGHEVNAGVAFAIFAILFFLKWIDKERALFIILSSTFFALSFYTYQSEKIFVPALIVILMTLFWKRIFFDKKQAAIAFFVGIILVAPILKATLEPQALTRFRGTTAFSEGSPLYKLSAQRLIRDREAGSAIGLIFDNRRFVSAQIFLSNYLSHFDPRWLFTNSGEDRHKVPGMGLLYFWEIPFLILGIYVLIRGGFPKTSKTLIFAWILLAPLPASITSEAPHAMRIFNTVPFSSLLIALGLYRFFTWIGKGKLNMFKSSLACGFSFVVVFSFAYFYHNYFFNFPREQSKSFQYALSQAIPYVSEVQNGYDKIIFSNRDDLYQSYMFFLFFANYDPRSYLRQGGTVSGGFVETHRVGKFEFRQINWEEEEKNPRILYVGTPQELPSATLKTFRYLDGQEGIRIVDF